MFPFHKFDYCYTIAFVIKKNYKCRLNADIAHVLVTLRNYLFLFLCFGERTVGAMK